MDSSNDFVFKDLKYESEEQMCRHVHNDKYSLIKKHGTNFSLIFSFIIGLFFGIYFESILIFSLLCFGIPLYCLISNYILEKEIEKLSNRYIEIQKEKEENKKIFSEEQNKKGLFEFKNKWYKKEDIKELLIKEYPNKVLTFNSQGEVMVCGECNYLWNIKKSIGKPSKCPNCGKKAIYFQRIEAFGFIIKELKNENL